MRDESFLVDTSAWILALRKDYLPAVKDRIDQLLGENTVLTTGIVRLELLGGIKTEDEFRRLKNRLDALDGIMSDDSLWDKACELSFQLRRKGCTVPCTDILIATCALNAESTLVHADAHFDLMAGHLGLKVESFVKVARRHTG
jgi:predicted nucleic acid-binding protein